MNAQMLLNRTLRIGPNPFTVKPGRLCGLMLMSVVVASLTGCMIAPLDGETLPDKTTPLWFLGATPSPNQIMHIEVYNHRTEGWDIIGHTTTATHKLEAHGMNWYLWSCEVQISEYEFYWTRDTTGEYAEVRAKRFEDATDYEGLSVLTFKSWEWAPDEMLSTFYDRHGSGDTISRVYVR